MKTYDIRLNGSMYDYVVTKCELAMGTWAAHRDAERITDQIGQRLASITPDYWWPDVVDPAERGIGMHPLAQRAEEACINIVMGCLEPDRMRGLILEFEVAALELLEAIDKHDRMVAFHPVASRHLAAAC